MTLYISCWLPTRLKAPWLYRTSSRRSIFNTVSTLTYDTFHKCSKEVALKFINTLVVKTIKWTPGDVSGTALQSAACLFSWCSCIAEESINFRRMDSRAERLKCAVLDGGSRSLSHACITFLSNTPPSLSLTRKHTFLLLCLPYERLTYGDIEAVDAEGGTPTLPKPMLLGVGFHLFGNLRSAWHLFNLLQCLASVQLHCLVSVSFEWLPSWGVKKR